MASALATTPAASQNWGLESTRSLPPLPPRLIATLVSVLLILAAAPFLLAKMSSSEVSMKDDSFYALESYSRALSSGADLESALSPSELALLSSASRLETKDGPLLVLRGEFGCWAVSTAPAKNPAQPREMDSQFCP